MAKRRVILNEDQLPDFGGGSSEGLFTPTLIDSGGGYTYTLSASFGMYKKIGKAVFFNVLIGISSTSGSLGGTLRVGGLPFTSESLTANYSNLTLGLINGTNWTTAQLDSVQSAIGSNQNEIRFTTKFSTAELAAPSITAGILRISGTYFTN
tara:strand:- start:57 stop:512 length:456 start_codon:yes stop_codon:yes gene_type:complete